MFERFRGSHDTYFLVADFDSAHDAADIILAESGLAFAEPFALVTRKADGVKGALTFQHLPRFYFEFVKTEDVEN